MWETLNKQRGAKMKYRIIKLVQTEKTTESYPVAECVDFYSAHLIANALTDGEPHESNKRITFLIQP